MTVLLRAKRSPTTGLRSRPRIHREPGPRPTPGHPAPAVSGVDRRGDRRTPPPQDRALYNCGCGFVFSDDVSTTVACPHCGDAQAW
jgi:hypothetical protein